MFVGHYAVALAAKRAAPKTSLGTLMVGAQLLDLLWPPLLLLGLESVRIDPGNTAFTPLDFESYPISHSLLAVLGWGAAFGGLYWLARRYPRGALVAGLLVVSHWLLDAVVHRPDLPLVPGADVMVGLGLWSSVPATLAVELAIWAGAILLYVRTTSPLDRRGRWAFVGLVAALTLIYFANVFGEPPPSETTVAVVSLGLWLFVPWAYWVDRHRTAGAGGADGGMGGSGEGEHGRAAGLGGQEG